MYSVNFPACHVGQQQLKHLPMFNLITAFFGGLANTMGLANSMAMGFASLHCWANISEHGNSLLCIRVYPIRQTFVTWACIFKQQTQQTEKYKHDSTIHDILRLKVVIHLAVLAWVNLNMTISGSVGSQAPSLPPCLSCPSFPSISRAKRACHQRRTFWNSPKGIAMDPPKWFKMVYSCIVFLIVKSTWRVP